jgi:hypothetical protein
MSCCVRVTTNTSSHTKTLLLEYKVFAIHMRDFQGSENLDCGLPDNDNVLAFI